MSWLSVITSLISITAAIVDYLKSQKAIDGALAIRLSLHLAKAKAEILDAQNIRDSVDRRTSSELQQSDDGLFRD